MKKTILVLTFALLTFISSFAKNVDTTTAINVAKNFYSSKATINNIVDKKNLNLTLAYRCKLVTQNSNTKSEEENLYYIFNVNSNDGFVIISGDDIVTPVLGYSNLGSYEGANLPPAFQKWMENYRQQILFAKENNIEATDEIESKWDELINSDNNNQAIPLSTQAVSPLLTTTWNQSPYYNALCPGGSVTGCVATAMAQIMKFWNYPSNGIGFHSYNENDYGTLSANFASTTYNWGSMPNNVTSSNNAVATLMYNCGVSVDMDYSPSGSAANTSNVVNALTTYFNYSSTAQYVEQSNYTTSGWIQLLKNELNAGRPMQYRGSGNAGGHSFCCDGFDVNDYFHFNWGWGGSLNGFFMIGALNPGTSSFNDGPAAIIGIQPASGGGTSTIEMYSSITITPNPINFGQPFDVNADLTNSGNSNFSGDFCAALFTSSGDFIDYIQILTASGTPLQPGYHYTGGLTFSSTGILSVPGSYIVGIYYRDSGGNWNLVGDASYTNPIGVTISSPIDYIQLNSSIMPSPATFVQGQAASVNFNLVNDNTETYYGQYAAKLYDLSGNFVQTIGTINETTGLPAGYTYNTPYITLSTSSITATPGTYLLTIEELENGYTAWYLVGGDYYSQPIYIDVVAPALSPDIYENNNSQATAYTLPLNWSSNNAHKFTTGSNNHIGTDNDYYKINLPGGYNYTITARTHDSYNCGNGNTYTNDVLWSYDAGGGWSQTYDDIMTGNISVNGAGTVIFLVSPYFSGQTGSYLLDININRFSTVEINENNSNNLFEIYPNPTRNVINIENSGNYQLENLQILNFMGQVVLENKLPLTSENIDVSNLSNGIYFLQAMVNNKKFLGKFIINK